MLDTVSPLEIRLSDIAEDDDRRCLRTLSSLRDFDGTDGPEDGTNGARGRCSGTFCGFVPFKVPSVVGGHGEGDRLRCIGCGGVYVLMDTL